jgi:hypothetical protein
VPVAFERDTAPIGTAAMFTRVCGLFARCRLGRADKPTIRDLIEHDMLSELAPVFAALRSRREGVP